MHFQVQIAYDVSTRKQSPIELKGAIFFGLWFNYSYPVLFTTRNFSLKERCLMYCMINRYHKFQIYFFSYVSDSWEYFNIYKLSGRIITRTSEWRVGTFWNFCRIGKGEATSDTQGFKKCYTKENILKTKTKKHTICGYSRNNVLFSWKMFLTKN